jgi:uncharacterized FlaG/YvyC family protein
MTIDRTNFSNGIDPTLVKIYTTVKSGLLFLTGQASLARRVFDFTDTFVKVAKKHAIIAADKLAKVSAFLQSTPIDNMTVLDLVHSTRVLNIVSALNEMPNLYKHTYKIIKKAGAKKIVELAKVVKSAATICGRVGDFISGLSLFTLAVKISTVASRALAIVGLTGSAFNLGLDSRKLDKTRQEVKNFKAASRDYNEVRKFLKVDDLITSSDADKKIEEILQNANTIYNYKYVVGDDDIKQLIAYVKEASTEEEIRKLCKDFIPITETNALIDVLKLKTTTSKLCTLFSIDSSQKETFVKKLKTTFPKEGALGADQKSIINTLASRLDVSERNGVIKVILNVLGIAQGALLLASFTQPELLLGFATFNIACELLQYFVRQGDNYNFENAMGLRDRSIKVKTSGVKKIIDFAKWYFEKGTIHDIVSTITKAFSTKENNPVTV